MYDIYTCVYIHVNYSLYITCMYDMHMKHMYIVLELAVLALARIMCANIHSQNGTAILAQELLSRK